MTDFRALRTEQRGDEFVSSVVQRSVEDLPPGDVL